MKKVTKIGCAEPVGKPPVLRVAAYCLVSTDTDEQAESLDAQIRHYESYIKANPAWSFAGLYYDEGMSYGQNAKNP